MNGAGHRRCIAGRETAEDASTECDFLKWSSARVISWAITSNSDEQLDDFEVNDC